MEVVITLTFFSFVLIGVVMAVNNAYRHVWLSKLQVMAMNLTRGGMEMIYNIRDTNRRRYSGMRDDYWLKMDPFSSGSNMFYNAGLYSLTESINDGQPYFALKKYSGSSDASDLYENFQSFVASDGDFFAVQYS